MPRLFLFDFLRKSVILSGASRAAKGVVEGPATPLVPATNLIIFGRYLRKLQSHLPHIPPLRYVLSLLTLTPTALALTPTQPIPFDQARRAADHILAQPEFRTVTQDSLLQRWLSKLVDWVYSLINSIYRVGTDKPWILTLIEWSLFTIAVAAVLVWCFRVMKRQQLAIQFETATTDAVWRAESDNWAELARAQAAAGEWREAVHSLYWATIVMLEGRKFWRPNRARTPREYLRLLEPNSPRQQSLGGLTGIFERIWYGNRPASETDYARALALFEELRLA